MVGGLLKSTSALAILAAAGLLIGGVTMAPKAAHAADLGGDCCADLEERVANLEATTVTKGNRKVSLQITGRVDATVTYWTESAPGKDPGFIHDSKSDLNYGDHTGQGPQIVFQGSATINKDVSAGFYLETNPKGIGGGSYPGGFSGDSQVSSDAPGDKIALSDVYVYLSSKSLGTVQLGHVDNAGDEWNNIPGGGGDVAWVGGQEMGRYTSVYLRDTAGHLTTTTFGSLLSTIEPGNPGDGIRYISPNLFGSVKNQSLTFTASDEGDNIWGVGANYAGTFNTVTLKLAAGYSKTNELDGVINPTDQYIAGIGGLISESGSGLYVGFNASKLSNRTAGYQGVALPDKTEWQVQGGWSKNVNGAGNTTIWGDYGTTNNAVLTALNNSKAHVWQVGIDQKIDAAAMHLFLTYENDSLDNSLSGLAPLSAAAGNTGIVNSQDVTSITAGASIQF